MRSTTDTRRATVRRGATGLALAAALAATVTGTGPLDRLVDNRLGLPAATGDAMRLSAYYTFRTYDQLLPR
ncbi:hypothetical protein [Streptomyces sp. NPDC008139]|uniref:hypothetical protein n=1 Tax=Streptomyces sp. NPDC008139 TaxID=3364814 RepID=UPI0036EB499E